MARSVSSKLECLSEMEARKIGRSLMPALKQRKTAVAGLHQWKMQVRRAKKGERRARQQGAHTRANKDGGGVNEGRRRERRAAPFARVSCAACSFVALGLLSVCSSENIHWMALVHTFSLFYLFTPCAWQNRSMVELFERYNWVESMLLEMAQDVMNTAPWGLMWRVCTGAFLSVLDMVTDVVVIMGYMGKEETRGYGYSLMGMLVGCMVLQLFVVFLQNRKKPWAIAKEVLVVVTGLKGPFDAIAVCRGQKKEEHHVIDAKQMLVAAKMCEMVCESIPGCLLQMYVLLKVGDTGKREMTSLVISSLTAGYSSGTLR